MDVTFSDAKPTTAPADLLVLGVASGQIEATLTEALGSFGTQLAAWLSSKSFEAKAGQIHVVPSLGATTAAQVAIVGIGKGDITGLCAAAGKAGQLARNEKATSLALALGALDAQATQAVVEYAHIGNYVYDTYMPDKHRKPGLTALTLLGTSGDAQHQAALKAAGIRARYQRLARDLVNGPAAQIYPETLAAEAKQLGTIDGVTVKVMDFETCRREGLVGVIAVGQGSSRPGCMIHLSYRPAGAVDHIALVGKGVTFDSGGLSLKPSSAMQTMRCDMGGAATTIAAFGAIAELGLPVSVDAFVPAVENMAGANSFKLGDILTYRNGVSVEIHNTDAEGRLVLADALILASEIDGVSRIVDMATLTGAIVVALGPDYTGLFTGHDELAEALTSQATEAGEKLWRMPLDKNYNRMLKGTWGQIKNVGGREAGSTTAALFLQHFVREDVQWAHLDIAGTAFFDSANDPYAAGGTGQVVRTLVNWAASLGK